MNVKIVSPAGSRESLMAAIKAGAHAVYFGVEHLNMRAKAANNFSISELPEIVSLCHQNHVKAYLTLNTIMYNHDLVLLEKILCQAKESKLDAIIASDIATIQKARERNLAVHISTQLSISNIEGVRFYSQFAEVIVLARELTLSQIKEICSQIRQQNITSPSGNLLEVEIFAHGAMCVAISGICQMSLATFHASANRGSCFQNCRRTYRVIDEVTNEELVLDNQYIMSPKDLCTISFLDQLLASGISYLKIEGRGRPADYVYKTTKAYREAIDSVENKTYSNEKVSHWLNELESVYNKGFWHGGYYLGKSLGEWSGVYGSASKTEKIFIGVAQNYFSQKKIAHFVIQSSEINELDHVYITGPTTGFVETQIKNLYINGKPGTKARKDDEITFFLSEKVRPNDKLFRVIVSDINHS